MHNLMFLNDWRVKSAQPIAAIQNLATEEKQQSQKTPKSEKTTKQLLGEFYSDKKYLENLLKDEGTMLYFFIFCLLFLFTPHCAFVSLHLSFTGRFSTP